MYFLLKTCPPGHYHNSFMATGALGHTRVWLHVVDIQDPNKVQVNTRHYSKISKFVLATEKSRKSSQKVNKIYKKY